MEKSPFYFPKEEKEKQRKFFNGERGRDKKVKKLRKKKRKERKIKNSIKKKKNNVGFTILSFVTDLLAEAVYLTASDAVGRGGGKYAQYPCRPVLLVYRKIKSGTGLGLASPVFDDRLVSLLSLHLQFLLLV